MSKSFEQGCEELSALIGDGDLVGTFRVDAGARTIPLEAGFWQNYRGSEGFKKIENYNDGGPHFVGGPIAEKHRDYLEDIADATLDTGPTGSPTAGMIRAMEGMTEELRSRAPIREGSLRESGAEFVIDDGSPVHESYGASYGQELR